MSAHQLPNRYPIKDMTNKPLRINGVVVKKEKVYRQSLKAKVLCAYTEKRFNEIGV